MKKETPITNLLAKTHEAARVARECEYAQTDLYGYYIHQVRSQAASRMSPALKQRRTPTSLAHEALTSCLKNAQTTQAPIASRSVFEKYLNHHLNQRIASAAAHEQAQKRDMHRDSTAYETPESEDRSLSPDSQAITNELAIKSIHCLYEEPDEARRAIAVLGLLLNYSASQIQEAIRPLVCESEDDDLPPGYSLSSIRQVLKKRKTLHDHLIAEFLSEKVDGVDE